MVADSERRFRWRCRLYFHCVATAAVLTPTLAGVSFPTHTRRLLSLLVLSTLLLFLPDAAVAREMKSCAGEPYVTASDGRVFCEQHFSAHDNCSGADQLPIIEMPWEQSQVSIRGVTLVFIAERVASGYVFAGNSFNHDVMAWLDPAREGTIRQWFPDGLSFQFPGIADELATSRSRVDLHVLCQPAGTPFTSYLILYYTIP